MSLGLVITIDELPFINYFLQKISSKTLGYFSYYSYLCNRIGFSKTENFLEIRRRKVVQNGKPSRKTNAIKFA